LSAMKGTRANFGRLSVDQQSPLAGVGDKSIKGVLAEFHGHVPLFCDAVEVSL